MIGAAASVLVAAVALDLVVGEWPRRIHPVAWFGRIVGRVDSAWRRPRAVGIAAAIGLPCGAAVVAWGLVHAASSIGPLVGVVVGAVVLFSTVSLRMLLDVAREVDAAAGRDLAAAREAVRALVGRNVAELDAAGLRGATIESLAENLSDGFIAPLTAFAVGAQVSVAVGVAAAAWVKAVNTMDSMLGYHDVATGWASARLDDAAMVVPARLTAAFLAAAAVRPGALPAARTDARVPASPNAGWPMATLATAIDVRLEKPGHYVLNDGGKPPTGAHVRRAVRTTGVAGLLAAVLAGVVVW